MFRRVKREGDEPLKNQLRIEAEPNVLGSSTSGPDANELEWTADGLTGGSEVDDELDADDELDEAQDGEADDGLTPEQRQAALQAELQREAEEYGLTGDNPVGLYGPNGEEVADLLDALNEIDVETAEAIADAYEEIPDAERQVAQSVVRRRHRHGKWEYELSLAERSITDWISSLKLTDSDDVALYAIVANAATDAVDALILEEDLADADFATLYDAWSEVMDEDEDEADGEADEAGEAGAGHEAEAGGKTETAKPRGKKGSADGDATDAEAETVDPDEGPADGPFGPNSELVVEFLGKLGDLDLAQTSELVAAWREQPKEELKVAHRALQAAADEDQTWREQLRLAQEEVFAWMDHRPTSILTASNASMEETRARELAGPSVADAIAALVLADILEADDAETLYAPWADVVGEPALPTYEDGEGEGEGEE